MMVEVHLFLKSNILSWSDQSWYSELSNGAKIKIIIAYTDCKVIIEYNTLDEAKELFYTIWELLAWYDGYFYKPTKYIVDGKMQEVDELYRVNMYKTDKKWVDSGTLIGRNQRDFSEDIINRYLNIRNADRKNKSMNKAMINSFFYLMSESYKDINIEHRLVLLMHICDGFAIKFLNGSSKNNSGNINIIVGQLDKRKYKHGAGLLGVSESNALTALGDTRNELTHYDYNENSLGSYISDPDCDTDNTVNLYAYYILIATLRVAVLQTIGFTVTDEVKEYLLDENLDWIRLEKDIEEKCVIPMNQMRQMIKKLQNTNKDNEIQD